MEDDRFPPKQNVTRLRWVRFLFLFFSTRDPPTKECERSPSSSRSFMATPSPDLARFIQASRVERRVMRDVRIGHDAAIAVTQRQFDTGISQRWSNFEQGRLTTLFNMSLIIRDDSQASAGGGTKSPRRRRSPTKTPERQTVRPPPSTSVGAAALSSSLSQDMGVMSMSHHDDDDDDEGTRDFLPTELFQLLSRAEIERLRKLFAEAASATEEFDRTHAIQRRMLQALAPPPSIPIKHDDDGVERSDVGPPAHDDIGCCPLKMTSSRFVAVVQEALARSGHQPGKLRHVEQGLKELFDQIDFNGSGDIDWEELTQFLMFAAERGAAEDQNEKPALHMVRHFSVPRGLPGSAELTYVPSLDMCMLWTCFPADDRTRLLLLSIPPAASVTELAAGSGRTKGDSNDQAGTGVTVSSPSLLALKKLKSANGLSSCPGESSSERDHVVSELMLADTVLAVQFLDEPFHEFLVSTQAATMHHVQTHEPLSSRRTQLYLRRSRTLPFVASSLAWADARVAAPTPHILLGTNDGRLVAVSATEWQSGRGGLGRPTFDVPVSDAARRREASATDRGSHTQSTTREPLTERHDHESVTRILIIRSGKKAVAATLFGHVMVIDLRRMVVLHSLSRASDRIGKTRELCFAPVLNVLATAGHGSSVSLWMPSQAGRDCGLGELEDRMLPHRDRVVAMWTDPRTLPGQLVTFDAEGVSKKWDLRTMRCLETSEPCAVLAMSATECRVRGDGDDRGTNALLPGDTASKRRTASAAATLSSYSPVPPSVAPLHVLCGCMVPHYAGTAALSTVGNRALPRRLTHDGGDGDADEEYKEGDAASGTGPRGGATRFFLFAVPSSNFHGQLCELALAPVHELNALKDKLRHVVTLVSSVFVDDAHNRLIYTYGDTVVMFDLRTGRISAVLPAVISSGEVLSGVSVDATGRRLVLGSRTGTVAMVNAATGVVVGGWRPHDAAVSFVWTEHPSLLVSVSADGVVKLFDSTGERQEPFSQLTLPLVFPARVSTVTPHVGGSSSNGGVASSGGGTSTSFIVCDTGHRIHIVELLESVSKIILAGEHLIPLPRRPNMMAMSVGPGIHRVPNVPRPATSNNAALDPSLFVPPAAVVNDETNRQVYDFVKPKIPECTAVVSLAPTCPAFVVADASGYFYLMSDAHVAPACSVLFSWEHVPPREHVEDGSTVVAAMHYRASDNTVFAADDHGCVALWDIHRMLIDTGLLQPAASLEEGEQVVVQPLSSPQPASAGQSLAVRPPSATTRGAAAVSSSAQRGDRRLRSSCDVDYIEGSITSPRLLCTYAVCPVTPLLHITLLKLTGEDVIAATASDGRVLLLTVGAGNVMGVMQFDKKYEKESPHPFPFGCVTPNAFDQMLEEQQRFTRAKRHWATVRCNVIGSKAVLAVSASAAVKRRQATGGYVTTGGASAAELMFSPQADSASNVVRGEDDGGADRNSNSGVAVSAADAMQEAVDELYFATLQKQHAARQGMNAAATFAPTRPNSPSEHKSVCSVARWQPRRLAGSVSFVRETQRRRRDLMSNALSSGDSDVSVATATHNLTDSDEHHGVVVTQGSASRRTDAVGQHQIHEDHAASDDAVVATRSLMDAVGSKLSQLRLDEIDRLNSRPFTKWLDPATASVPLLAAFVPAPVTFAPSILEALTFPMASAAFPSDAPKFEQPPSWQHAVLSSFSSRHADIEVVETHELIRWDGPEWSRSCSTGGSVHAARRQLVLATDAANHDDVARVGRKDPLARPITPDGRVAVAVGETHMEATAVGADDDVDDSTSVGSVESLRSGAVVATASHRQQHQQHIPSETAMQLKRRARDEIRVPFERALTNVSATIVVLRETARKVSEAAPDVANMRLDRPLAPVTVDIVDPAAPRLSPTAAVTKNDDVAEHVAGDDDTKETTPSIGRRPLPLSATNRKVRKGFTQRLNDSLLGGLASRVAVSLSGDMSETAGDVVSAVTVMTRDSHDVHAAQVRHPRPSSGYRPPTYHGLTSPPSSSPQPQLRPLSSLDRSSGGSAASSPTPLAASSPATMRRATAPGAVDAPRAAVHGRPMSAGKAIGKWADRLPERCANQVRATEAQRSPTCGATLSPMLLNGKPSTIMDPSSMARRPPRRLPSASS